MPTFNYTFTVDAPLEAVADFHNSTHALKKLAPPPMVVQLHRVEPLAEGSVSEFTMWLGPLPIRWKAVHSQVSENGFTDTQVEGPAAHWKHTHTFTALNDEKTQVSEHIEYQHGTGWWGILTRMLFAYPGLWFMFSYRRFITRLNVRHQQVQYE